MVNNPTAEYWKKRFEQLEQSQHNMGVQAYADIEQQYRKAQRQIEGQINAWYGRFANNNNVTLEEARRMLSAKELDELKWDVHEYIKYAEDNALSGQWVKELENASARYHISRLEALKLQTQQSLEVMFGNQLDTFDDTLSQVYKSGFYRTAFELQKGIGVGWDFGTLDDAQIAKVINKPWAVDGRNFSQRIWGNKTKLINELNQTLTQNIVLGKDPQKAIDQIAKKLNTSKHNAGRLVMTEEAFFSSEAQKDCFKELDVEEYEIVATLDSHTSDICQEMDGKHFEISKWEVGATAPPFHVYCRSTTVPYFADDFGQPGERAARMADGEPTYHVPADMTYKQWQKSFLGGGDKSGLKKNSDGVKIKTESKPKKSTFVPAKSIDEAEEYAKRFVQEKSWSGDGNVSYQGLTLDVANRINEVLTGAFDDIGMPKLRNLQPMNFRSKIFKDAKDAPFCYKSAFNGDLHFNQNLVKSEKTIAAYKKKGDEAFEFCKTHFDQLKGKQREMVEIYLKAGRQTIADDCEDFLKAMVEHELGHHIQHNIIYQNKEFLDVVKKGMEEYGIKISGYATSSVGEYIAESFSAYRNGYADLIDPELLKIFEGLVK